MKCKLLKSNNRSIELTPQEFNILRIVISRTTNDELLSKLGDEDLYLLFPEEYEQDVHLKRRGAKRKSVTEAFTILDSLAVLLLESI